MPIPHDIQITLRLLPPGQRAVVEALIGMGWARSYASVATSLNLHLGTVHTHLRRLRETAPELYAAIMQVRGLQLAQRHV